MADDRSVDLGPKAKLCNIILLGVTFMLIFTGFQTAGIVSQTVLTSYKKEHPEYNGDGYTSLAIAYSVFAVGNWIGPSIVSILGPKISMIVAAMAYTAYIATFIKPVTATLYVGSVLLGLGAAVLWTAHGNFLTLNSDDSTMGRNSGLFWALYQCSFLIGNLYVYLAWKTDHISDAERVPLFIGLTVITGVGLLLMFFFRSHPKPVSHEDTNDKSSSAKYNISHTTTVYYDATGDKSVSVKAESSTSEKFFHDSTVNEFSRQGKGTSLPLKTYATADKTVSDEEGPDPNTVSPDNKVNDSATAEVTKGDSLKKAGRAAGAWHVFIKAVKMFKTRDMLLLSITFFYLGLLLTFYSGVYGFCVGSTSFFGNEADRYVGLTGIMIGVGEIFAGATFGIFGKQTVKYGRTPVIVLGFFLLIIAYILIFLNIPDEAPLRETDTLSFITPNVIIAVGCGVFLGSGDACFNTQCFSILGVMYPEDSAPAFALFKFVQALAAATAFFYSNHLVLKWQLLILVIFSVLGSSSFIKVERSLQSRRNESKTTVL